MRIASIQPDHSIRLPDDWVEEFHLHGFAALEKGSDGILVRACSGNTWDEVFSEKLPVGRGNIAFEVSELSGDDYLF
jgi:hypothetical protein